MRVCQLDIFLPFHDSYHTVLETINERVGQAVATFFDLIASSLSIPVIGLFLDPLISGYIAPFSAMGRIASALLSLASPILLFLGANVLIKARDEYREVKIGRMIELSQSNRKKGVIIETSDWSDGNHSVNNQIITFLTGNFRLLSYLFNVQKITKTHSVTHITARSEDQLLEELDQLEPVDFVWIRGHGEKNGVMLGNDFFWHIDDSDRLMTKLSEKVMRSAKIVISSCETGAGEHNFAKVLSKYCPGAEVYAPNENINSLMGTSLNEDLTVRFAGGLSKSIETIIYKDGNQINRPAPSPNLEVEFA